MGCGSTPIMNTLYMMYTNCPVPPCGGSRNEGSPPLSECVQGCVNECGVWYNEGCGREPTHLCPNGLEAAPDRLRRHHPPVSADHTLP